MEEQKRRFDGIWIPANVWLNKDLSPLDKIVLAEVNSLDDDETHCFASNEYLAEFCQCSERKVTESLGKLKSLGFIEQISFNGRTRILKIASQSSKNCYADSQNLLGEIYNIDYNINNKENILKENSNIQQSNFITNTNLTSSTMVDMESVGPSSKTNALTREKLSVTDTSRTLENKPSHTNKPSVDSGKEIISFILKDNSEFKVTEDIYNEYKQLYPDINIMQELRSLKAWCISNPSKRKTRKGALRFINGWFLRRQGQYYNNTSNNNYKAKVETKPAQQMDWHFEKNGMIGLGK